LEREELNQHALWENDQAQSFIEDWTVLNEARDRREMAVSAFDEMNNQ
jgi:hypothetical protein